MKKFRFKLARKAILKKCSEFRGNGRVYPMGVLQEAVKECNKKMRNVAGFGELPHPIIMLGQKIDPPSIARIVE